MDSKTLGLVVQILSDPSLYWLQVIWFLALIAVPVWRPRAIHSWARFSLAAWMLMLSMILPLALIFLSAPELSKRYDLSQPKVIEIGWEVKTMVVLPRVCFAIGIFSFITALIPTNHEPEALDKQ